VYGLSGRINTLVLWLSISLLVLSVTVAGGCGKGGGEGADTIRLGGVYALTGRAATFGTWAKNGADLAVAEINEAGGILGKKLAHIVEDTQSEPKNAVTAFTKLIDVDHANAAVGFVMSGEALACAPIAQRTQTVMITPVAGTEKLKEAGEFVFRTRESSLFQANAMAEFAVNQLNITRAGILFENAANAFAYKTAFGERFRELGGTISGEWGYDEATTDFRPYLLRIKDGSNPAVFAPGISTAIGRILNQATQLDVQTQWLCSAGIEDPKLFDMAGGAANGVYFATSKFSLDAESGRTAEFVANYRDRYGEDPSVYAANAYDTVMLLAECFKKRILGGMALSNALVAIKGFEGASGTITFDQDGEVFKPTVVKIVQNSEFLLYQGE